MSQINELTALQQKFIKKVKMVDNHWIWLGSRNNVTGYGCYTLTGKMTSAHRASYRLFKGEIKNVLHHTCGIKICVNPHHLEDITQKENMLKSDGMIKSTKGQGKINSQKIHCPRGHDYRSIKDSSTGKTKRICDICINSRRTGLAEFIYCGIDLVQTKDDKQKLKESQKKLQDPITKHELEKIFSFVNTKFEIGVFRQAVRILLFMKGINCYSPNVVQCQRVLAKLFQSKEINLYDVASLLDLHETITKNKKKLPDDILGDKKK